MIHPYFVGVLTAKSISMKGGYLYREAKTKTTFPKHFALKFHVVPNILQYLKFFIWSALWFKFGQQAGRLPTKPLNSWRRESHLAATTKAVYWPLVPLISVSFDFPNETTAISLQTFLRLHHNSRKAVSRCCPMRCCC